MLASIGRVAAECAAVEDQLRDLFCYLIDSNYGRVITAGEDLSHITTLCLRVARYNSKLSDEQVEQLVAIVKAVDELRPRRNFLIHATWRKLDLPGEHVGIRSSRASTRPLAQGITDGLIWTPADADRLADDFQLLGEYISVFKDRTFSRVPFVIPIERHAWDKFNAFFAGVFSTSIDEDPSPPPSAPLDMGMS
jgi:hypothetical protein